MLGSPILLYLMAYILFPEHDENTALDQYYFERATIEDISQKVDRSADAIYKSLQRIRTALMDCVNGKLSTLEASS